MLKSLELKRNISDLKAEIQALIDAKQDVPARKQAALEDAMKQYEEVKAAEEATKGGNPMAEKVTKKAFNAALKKFLLAHDSADLMKLYSAAAGQNGAVLSDGGALVPEEMLDIAENDKYGVDLRPYTTAVTVSTRSGKIPAIDYSQDVALADFDENNKISETKAAFTQLSFTLANKGAIIPVSIQLLKDASADVLGIISTLFNRIYVKDVDKAIIAAAAVGAKTATVTDFATVAGLDAIKKAIIASPIDAGANSIVVMNQTTFAAMATAKDKQDRYLMVRDANNATIRELEGCPVVVVEDAVMDADKVVVGDFRAIYHVAYPELEVASSDAAGFDSYSVKVRVVCRYVDINTYAKAFTVITKG